MVDNEEILKLTKYAIAHFKNSTELYGSYEDMLQEMLLEVYKRIPQYSPETSKISTFIVMIVRTKFLQDLRKSKYNTHKVNYGNLCRSLQEEILTSGNQSILLQDTIEDKQNAYEELEIKMLVDMISPYIEDVTRMYYFEDMGQAEIAERLNLSQANVSRKIRQNLLYLRSILEGKPKHKKMMGEHKALKYAREHKCSVRTAYRHLQRRINYDK